MRRHHRGPSPVRTTPGESQQFQQQETAVQGKDTMRRAPMLGALVLFAVGCSSRPIGGPPVSLGPAGSFQAPGAPGSGRALLELRASLAQRTAGTVNSGQGAARWESLETSCSTSNKSNVRTEERDTIKQSCQLSTDIRGGPRGPGIPWDRWHNWSSASGGSRPSATPWWPAEPRRTGFESAPKEGSIGTAVKTPRGASRRIAGWKCSCGPMRVRQRGNGSSTATREPGVLMLRKDPMAQNILLIEDDASDAGVVREA